MANKNIRAEEVKATLELRGVVHAFNSQTTSVTLKDGRLLVEASQTVFGPFRIYKLNLNIAQDAPANTYVLDGKPDNTIQVSYFPPNGDIFNFYKDESGSFVLTQAAALDSIHGTFACVSKSQNDQITERANITGGEVSIDGSLTLALSQGTLSGTFDNGAGQGQFTATQNITTRQVGSYLQVEAVNDTSTTRLYLLIPTQHLGGTELPITDKEDGQSALAILLHDKSYQGTTGKVIFHYNPDAQTLSGTFEFSAPEEKFSFSEGKFDITG
ncbi:hypothetical protein [Pseudomonas poae]|uniref:Uncharacterized protein n=1 Tax=Pseudomonas poae TaxID=200451 RepID=A0A2S9EWR1_9PSED|nr:hypothetical protein [Pseudomonas poae]PRA32085.1 hypothetical protein CQZ97_05240 [Pseudomonas poae]PRC21026.1 hypothetical protein CQZ99_06685 [Pseudomonas poae]